MTGMVILDVVIGLIFIFLLLSLFCTIVNEWIAQWTSLRAKTLRRGITELFGDKRWQQIVDATGAKKLLDQPQAKQLKESLDQVRSFTEDFYKHPLIESLRKGASEPSYISSGTFARTVIDILRARATSAGIQLTGNNDLVQGFSKLTERAGQALEQAKNANAITPELAEDIRKILDGTALTRVIETLAIDTAREVEDVQQRLSAWFDEGMERVSGWYKRYLQYIGFAIGLVVALAFNADAINMTSVLAREPAMRAALVQSATKIAETCKDESCKELDAVLKLKNKDKLLPLGWQPEYLPGGLGSGLLWLIGLLLTAVATTLGAPFWFDLLKKLVNIRTSGLVPEAKRNR